ncbi:MAG: sugar ABC transporter ATP-binding protein [Lachnospiraceae bacterium]|nr:sugar ABC transporter ATP-binding protein [Lachnospiraceae bacterium]
MLLEVKNISKNFGVTQALSDVSLNIEAGSIHSLLGRNGAGKSTLVNIIAGLYPQSEGTVLFEGKDIKEFNVFDRQRMGIRLVPQHESVISHMSVAENIFLGLWPKKTNGMIDWERIFQEAQVELENYGLFVDPREEVRHLSSVDTRKVNIIRAMHGGAKLIILDEPTTALTDKERQELFGFVNNLKEKGTAFIFISHYLNEVMELSDDITVVRDGKGYQGMPEGVEITEKYLAHLVAGEEVELTRRKLKKDPCKSKKVIECKNLVGQGLDQVSLDIYEGEILGLVGFPGSGAREICRALAGLNKLESGEIHYLGKKLRIRSPKDAMDNFISYISHDRHREGLTPQFTINENIGIPIMKTKLKKKFGFIDMKKERLISQQYKEILNIKCNTIDDCIGSLSGGNQQKVVVGKFLSNSPQVLILDEPTIGIDIKSREEIISTVNDMTEKNVSVLYLTNDFEELLRVADRLIFFRDSQIVEEIINKDLKIEDITALRDNVD